MVTVVMRVICENVAAFTSLSQVITSDRRAAFFNGRGPLVCFGHILAHVTEQVACTLAQG